MDQKPREPDKPGKQKEFPLETQPTSLEVSKPIKNERINIHDRIIQTALQESTLPENPDDLPNGEECLKILLENRDQTFPHTRKIIQFNNGGDPLWDEWAEDDPNVKPLERPFYIRKAKENINPKDSLAIISNAKTEASRLLSCQPGDINLTTTTSKGIENIINKIDFKDGDRIIVGRNEYPYPDKNHNYEQYKIWEDLKIRLKTEKNINIEIVKVGVTNGFLTPADVDEALKKHKNIRLVAINSVGYTTGQKADLAEIAQNINKYNSDEINETKALFLVDGVQSIGAYEINVKDTNIDFLLSGGHKYLLSERGCGLIYSSQNGRRNLTTEIEDENIPIEKVAALNAGIKLVNKIGLDVIEQQNLKLANHFIEGVKQKGYEVLEVKPSEKTNFVFFRNPVWKNEKEIWDLVKPKENEKEIDLRPRKFTDKDYARITLHYYNTFDEINELLKRLPSIK